MAHQPLHAVAEEQQIAKRYVERCLKSRKRNKVFCLVEGEFDYNIYSTRLNIKHIEVVIAEDKRKKAGYQKVVKFVRELRTDNPNARVIGIRDKDYSILLGWTYPEGVYHTDHRDIEMSIFSSESFMSFDPTLKEKISRVAPYCRYLAHLRIFNEFRELKCPMKDKVKISEVYNMSSSGFYTDWQNRLSNALISNSKTACTQEEIDNFIVEQNLVAYADYDICRGHDVISLMGIVYGNCYHQSNMEEKMHANYSKENFYSTNLFSSIQQYCDQFKIDAKAS